VGRWEEQKRLVQAATINQSEQAEANRNEEAEIGDEEYDCRTDLPIIHNRLAALRACHDFLRVVKPSKNQLYNASSPSN